MNQIELKARFAVPAAAIYQAWLDPTRHGAMSYGGAAHIAAVVGGAFDCGDGYVRGTTLELEPGRRIVQGWRTSDFAEGQPDTRLELDFVDSEKGCELTLVHNGFPEEQVEEYRQGWKEYYLEPMKRFFGAGNPEGKPKPKTQSR
jgi:activator of HSP90 ATPase